MNNPLSIFFIDSDLYQSSRRSCQIDIMSSKPSTSAVIASFLLALSTPTALAANVSLSEQPISIGATRSVLTYGPFHAEPRSMYPHTPSLSEQKPCTDCYLVKTQVELQNLDGTTANFNNGATLHHLMQFNTEQSDPICPMNDGNLFLVSGNERNV